MSWSLEADLQELERTSPEVAEAARKYDEMRDKILRGVRMEKQNQQADDRCHQCKAHGATEIELNEGPGARAGVDYSFKGMLCGIHAAEMGDHFDGLKRKRTGQ